MRHYLVVQAGDDVEIAWQYKMSFSREGHPEDYTPTTKVVYTAPPKPVAQARGTQAEIEAELERVFCKKAT